MGRARVWQIGLLMVGVATAGASGASARPAKKGRAKAREQVIAIAVTKKGFEPDRVTAKAGAPIKLVVTRKTDHTCAKEIVIADLGVDSPLPLGKAVEIALTPQKAGAYRYNCPMDMIAGVLVVK